MVEGWLGSDYFILYVDSEMALASERYGIGTWLPGFDILGLRNWDDFIIRDSAGHTYTVPTVPIMRQYVTSYVLPNDLSLLRDDEDLRGKVKWYVKPLVFGGAISHENMTWMSHKAHGEAVRWWNDLYRSTKHPS